MNDDVTRTRDEIAGVVAEALRHLAWLGDAGIREVPPRAAPPAPAPARPPPARAVEGPVGGTSTGASDVGPRAIPPVTRAAATAPSTPASGAPAPTPATLSDKGCGSPELLAVREALGDCARCGLGGGRKHLVFGVGNPGAELMFVGEGPGADEDRQGEPFVGRAGQLLTKMIEAMGFRREEVYIANVVKCRPPENRNPEPDEMDACEPFLRRQIGAVKPKVIVALGKIAAQRLLRDPTPISRLRGRWFELEGVRLMPTFHPAYLLRSPDEKKKAWEDLQLVMKELGKPVTRR